MELKIITVASNQLEYVVFNKEATKCLLCFHGFGQSGTEYAKLAKVYPAYKIVAVNLFFHQNSLFRSKKVLQASHLRAFLYPLIETEFQDKFSLVGYSMGGRFALTALKLFPEKVKAIHLMAPDGLVEGNWYRFATRTSLQRKIFRKSFDSFPAFLAVATQLSKVGVLNKGLFKFAQIHLKTQEERERVYNTWTYFRDLKLSPTELDLLLTRHQIHCTIILGLYDRVIPIQRIAPKLKQGPWLTVLQVPITHNKLFYYNFLDDRRNSSVNSNE